MINGKLLSPLKHCGEIWGPNAVVAQNQFEPIQKRAVKWILSESNRRYNEAEYMNQLKALNLLPIQLKKLRLFYRIRKDSIVLICQIILYNTGSLHMQAIIDINSQ